MNCWFMPWFAPRGASVFAYHVHDHKRYGVAEFDAQGKVLSLDEKPQAPMATTPSPACTSTTPMWWSWSKA